MCWHTSLERTTNNQKIFEDNSEFQQKVNYYQRAGNSEQIYDLQQSFKDFIAAELHF